MREPPPRITKTKAIERADKELSTISNDAERIDVLTKLYDKAVTQIEWSIDAEIAGLTPPTSGPPTQAELDLFDATINSCADAVERALSTVDTEIV